MRPRESCRHPGAYGVHEPQRLANDAATDLYTPVWKTRKNRTGCRQLVLKLDDGKEYQADFEFFG